MSARAAKKKTPAKKSTGPSFAVMIQAAIKANKDKYHGASRSAISNYIAQTYRREQNGMFNAFLRRALAAAIKNGTLKYGSTQQRYKRGPNQKAPAKKKRAAPKKKKTTTRKKKQPREKKQPPRKKKQQQEKKNNK